MVIKIMIFIEGILTLGCPKRTKTSGEPLEKLPLPESISYFKKISQESLKCQLYGVKKAPNLCLLTFPC